MTAAIDLPSFGAPAGAHGPVAGGRPAALAGARLSLLVALGFAAGCPSPSQGGGLAGIDTEGFVRRMALICRAHRADPVCAAPVEAGRAEVGAAASDGEPSTGVTGRSDEEGEGGRSAEEAKELGRSSGADRSEGPAGDAGRPE